MIYEYRNARYHHDGGIDCEINHPEHGWLPHLVHAHDNPEFFAHIENEGPVAPYVQPEPTNADVTVERDRRALAGKTFTLSSGPQVAVAGDDITTRNLQALALAAQARMAVGDDTATPYRDETNTIHNLTPAQVFELWSQGSAYVSAIYQASWALKDNPAGIPADFTGDHHWPA